MKQLVTLDSYRKGEEQSFSIIETYPYLHYENSEEDVNNLFQISLDPNKATLYIHVRSEEAQKEISSYLIAYDFEDVECLSGNLFGILECLPKVEEDVQEEPKLRNYYTIYEKNLENWLMSKSRLSIKVTFGMEKLEKFKEVIKGLRKRYMYRNKWLSKDGHYMIG